MSDNLSPIKKAALQLLDKLKEQVVMECDEEELIETMAKCHPSTLTDYINPEEYCNADEAMEMLHLGRNRAKFFVLLKKYKVKNHKVNNQPIGYKIKDIKRIRKEILD